jgi:hypothetical protein
MLFGYKYLPDKIDVLQTFITHTILEVLCKSNTATIFSIDLFHPRFREMVMKINDKYIFTPIQNSYNICKYLPKKQIRVLEKAVRVNNQVEKLCKGELEPVTFEEIGLIDTDLEKNLDFFNKSLYENVLGLKPFYSIYRHIDEHYKLFSKHNNFNRCPACGLKRMLKPEEVDFNDKGKREAYDHYFNKARYPFSAINFRNLIPMCDDCNSKYKTQRDIITDQGKRVKAFFPFSAIPEKDFSLKYEVEKDYLKNVEVSIACLGYSEEVETWNRVFSVKSRYKTFFEGEDCKNALEQALLFKALGGDSNYIENLKNNLYSNENFLKISIVEDFFKK